ncbi:LytTR family transcriptional regulator DNA-binding domain-containing protein [Psychroserpens sp.]
MTLPLNASFKYHTIIAVIISLWLVLFLILIAPFDIADLDFSERLEILPIYGVISFMTYMALVPVQNWIFKRFKQLTVLFEVLFIAGINAIQIIIAFIYYKSEIVNGEYNFQKWALEVYLPIGFILLTIVVFSRWFLNKKTQNNKHKKLIIKGDNKLDVLQVLPEELVCISSADNYVEVSFLNQGKLQKKLLRNTLKAIQTDIPMLLKVHRSHLINPSHFKAWNGSSSIILTQMEIPVSKNYKTALLELNQSSLKTSTLSQS